MVESVLDLPAGQLDPVTAFYWPAAVCPCSQSAELLSDEAAGQHEVMEAHLEPQPQPAGPRLHGCCLLLLYRTGVWLGRNVGGVPSRGTERDQKEVVGQVILVETSLGHPCPLHLQRLSSVLPKT